MGFVKIGELWINLSAVTCFDPRADSGSIVYLLGGKELLLDDVETAELDNAFHEIMRALRSQQLGLR